jgi:hypothetical protein
MLVLLDPVQKWYLSMSEKPSSQKLAEDCSGRDTLENVGWIV